MNAEEEGEFMYSNQYDNDIIWRGKDRESYVVVHNCMKNVPNFTLSFT